MSVRVRLGNLTFVLETEGRLEKKECLFDLLLHKTKAEIAINGFS